jgi:hypothetical protein
MRIDTRHWHFLHRERGAASRAVPEGRGVAVILAPFVALDVTDRTSLLEDWQDEASTAALAGNPSKAHYIEQWIWRAA